MTTSDFDLRRGYSRDETQRYPGFLGANAPVTPIVALNLALNMRRESRVQNMMDMIAETILGYDKFDAFR